ncbi:MAG: tetratricopeptide repeat protein, partial [Hyphomicrobium sp.]
MLGRNGARWVASVSLAILAGTLSAASRATDASECEQTELATLAIRACTTLIAAPDIEPMERARLYALRAAAWLREEEPIEAVADFSRTLELNPTSLDAMLGRARAHMLSGGHKEAIEDWTRIIAREPQMKHAHQSRAASRLAIGETDGALADYATALELDGNDQDAFIGRGKVYAHLDQRDAAIKDFDAAIAIQPANIAAHLAKAEAADKWGDKKMAITSYLDALRHNGMILRARRALQR